MSYTAHNCCARRHRNWLSHSLPSVAVQVSVLGMPSCVVAREQRVKPVTASFSRCPGFVAGAGTSSRRTRGFLVKEARLWLPPPLRCLAQAILI